MSQEEMKETSASIVWAGSETTATLLCGAVYYLLKNPAWLKKLQDELETNFQNGFHITFTSTGHLKILNAIIKETFRIYPPVSIFLPRTVPKEGATVAGTFIPPGNRIGIPQYATYRSSRNFKGPDVYAPERFLGEEMHAEDKRSVLQPFSVKPRSCISQNLA
jgi:cytochrome P450